MLKKRGRQKEICDVEQRERDSKKKGDATVATQKSGSKNSPLEGRTAASLREPAAQHEALHSDCADTCFITLCDAPEMY